MLRSRQVKFLQEWKSYRLAMRPSTHPTRASVMLSARVNFGNCRSRFAARQPHSLGFSQERLAATYLPEQPGGTAQDRSPDHAPTRATSRLTASTPTTQLPVRLSTP